MRRHIITPLQAIASIILLANWSSPETNVGSHTKQAVNFSGDLTTQNGKSYAVTNIAIGNHFKEIPFFEAVGKTASSSAIKKVERKLKNDPKEGIITKLDLADVYEIKVPNPDIIFSYQKRKGFRKNEFIEVVITANDEKKSSTTYLVDMRRKITCDKDDATQAMEEIPFNALKALRIKGYRERMPEEAKKSSKKLGEPEINKEESVPGDRPK